MSTFTKFSLCIVAVLPAASAPSTAAVGPGSITYEPSKAGPGGGKHIVFVCGEWEYRCEESLPMMAKILAERHGFRCTVLFSMNAKNGTVDPAVTTNIPDMHGIVGSPGWFLAITSITGRTHIDRIWPGIGQKVYVPAVAACSRLSRALAGALGDCLDGILDNPGG